MPALSVRQFAKHPPSQSTPIPYIPFRLPPPTSSSRPPAARQAAPGSQSTPNLYTRFLMSTLLLAPAPHSLAKQLHCPTLLHFIYRFLLLPPFWLRPSRSSRSSSPVPYYSHPLHSSPAATPASSSRFLVQLPPFSSLPNSSPVSIYSNPPHSLPAVTHPSSSHPPAARNAATVPTCTHPLHPLPAATPPSSTCIPTARQAATPSQFTPVPRTLIPYDHSLLPLSEPAPAPQQLAKQLTRP